jgi:amino acid transporter
MESYSVYLGEPEVDFFSPIYWAAHILIYVFLIVFFGILIYRYRKRKIKIDDNPSEIGKERKRIILLFSIVYLVLGSFLILDIISVSPLYLLYPAIFAFFVVAVRTTYLQRLHSAFLCSLDD